MAAERTPGRTGSVLRRVRLVEPLLPTPGRVLRVAGRPRRGLEHHPGHVHLRAARVLAGAARRRTAEPRKRTDLPDRRRSPALVDLYRQYVSPEVELNDLLCSEDLVDESGSEPKIVYRRGAYNPYNRWNTTDGIMHLTQPANSLQAEIQLAGDATILRERFGRRITDPDALICGTRYGGANRCSDPTIGASVNELAAIVLGHAPQPGWPLHGPPRDDRLDAARRQP